MRPYAPANRCTKVLTGHLHDFQKLLLKCDWSPNGKKVRQLLLERWLGAGRGCRRPAAMGKGRGSCCMRARG